MKPRTTVVETAPVATPNDRRFDLSRPEDIAAAGTVLGSVRRSPAPHGRRLGPRLAVALMTVAVVGGAAGQEIAMDDPFAPLRRQMVEDQIVRRGVDDRGVLEAMDRVPRHLFVPPAQRDEAYVDYPLPIGQGQTISQPYIVALMTELLQLDGTERVLEIGTGSGYQAAVLAELAAAVYTIEIREELAEEARRLLAELGYDNVAVRDGNGYRGWPEEAPFDAIIVTASPPEIPPALVEQLAVGGRMVIPVGAGAVQKLELLVKTARGELERREVVPVRFVPMIGELD